MTKKEVPRMPGIYFIKNHVLGKLYIGASMDLNRRARGHATDLKCGRHFLKTMQEDFDAGHAFSFEVILTVDTTNSYVRKPFSYVEAWYILYLKPRKKCYNRIAISQLDTNAKKLAINPIYLEPVLRETYKIYGRVTIHNLLRIK